MRTVLEVPNYALYWHDEDETILIMEVRESWTWTDAHRALDAVNKTVLESPQPVYVVIHFTSGRITMPTGEGALTNVRYLLSSDPSAELLTLYVGQSTFLQALMSMASKVYGLRSALEKLRFVTTLDEAFRQIEMHKQELRG